MVKILIQLMVTLVLWACSQQPSQQTTGISLNGKINFPQEGLVLLEEYGEKDITVIDTIEVQSDGSFDHQMSLAEPGFFRLNLYNQQMVNLILFQDNLEIVVDGNATVSYTHLTLPTKIV